ncbi:Ferredoxin [bacterium HR34]|nr:Ferredoxin [bacterium HR34]
MAGQKKQKKFKVKVLRDVCIGAGSCEAISPKVFKVDDSGKVFILDQGYEPDENGFVEITQDTFENVLDAAKSCPVFAIIVLDENGNQVYPPK